ncbi:MAG: hypothetical protein WCG66_07880 [bacterium]
MIARSVLVVCCIIATLVSSSAQNRDGNTVVETVGLVLVKPQPWSKPSEAEVVKFSAFTDRTARGSSGAGYFVFRLAGGNDLQIPNSRIVKLVIKPKVPLELVDDSQRQELQKKIDDLSATSASVPSASTLLAEYAKPLKAAVARYDAGEVMLSPDVWTTREKHRLSMIQKLEIRLRRSIADSKVKRDIDLKANADFAKLSELAESDTSLRSRLEALEVECAKLVSREEQEEIIVKLQPPLSPSQAALLIDKLRSLPDPSPRTASVLKQAETAVELKSQIDSVRQAFEQVWIADALAKGDLQPIPANLSEQIEALRLKIGVFQAAAPPEGIWMPTTSFQACAAVASAVPLLQERLARQDYRAVIQALDALDSPARQVGPQTSDALTVLKSYASERIKKFSILVDEGNKLLEGPDKKLAAAKFREALAVMPDPDLEKRLADLK